MKKSNVYYVITALGVFLLGMGLYFIKFMEDPQGILRTLPYISIGLGCGLFGHGMGEIISRKAIQTDPKIEKQIEIQKNDERNIAIAQKAKAKAYDFMTFAYAAMMIAFALMKVDMVVVLLLVVVYLFIEGYVIYLSFKYDKEM